MDERRIQNDTEQLKRRRRRKNVLLAGKESSPVWSCCSDGASRSGLFCVLYDVISRMTYDKEVDVFPTVRYEHSVRPQAVTLEVRAL